MRARFETEAAIVATRLRWLIGIVTLMAVTFAAAVLRGASRTA